MHSCWLLGIENLKVINTIKSKHAWVKMESHTVWTKILYKFFIHHAHLIPLNSTLIFVTPPKRTTFVLGKKAGRISSLGYIAQLVEHWLVDMGIVGSNPALVNFLCSTTNKTVLVCVEMSYKRTSLPFNQFKHSKKKNQTILTKLCSNQIRDCLYIHWINNWWFT